MAMDFAGSAQKWLDEQDQRAVRMAREILQIEDELRSMPSRTEYERIQRARRDGDAQGMCRALSYLGSRPGDISMTGARGFILNVQSCDDTIAVAKAAEARP